jgi:hypothetical protein
VGPVNCVLTSGTTDTCTKTCGGGTQTLTKTIITAPSCGGTACDPLITTQTCNTQACPVDCVYSAWGSYGTCSTTCGGTGSTMIRTRTIVTNATNGGIACNMTSLTDTAVNFSRPPANLKFQHI